MSPHLPLSPAVAAKPLCPRTQPHDFLGRSEFAPAFFFASSERNSTPSSLCLPSRIAQRPDRHVALPRVRLSFGPSLSLRRGTSNFCMTFGSRTSRRFALCTDLRKKSQ